MPETPVQEKEIEVLEAKEFETADFKPLYSKRSELPSESLEMYPPHLDLKLASFQELGGEDPGDEVMLVVKAKVLSKSEKAVCLRLEYAAIVHGKLHGKGERKISKVMHEYKKGTLKSGSGAAVTSHKQAVAIALSEARKAGANIAPNEKKRMVKRMFG